MLGRLIFSLNSNIAKTFSMPYNNKWHNSLPTSLLVSSKYIPQHYRSTVKKPCRQQFHNRARMYTSLQSNQFRPQLLNLIPHQPHLSKLQPHTRVTLLQVYLMLKAMHVLPSMHYSNRLLQLRAITCLHSLLLLFHRAMEVTR